MGKINEIPITNGDISDQHKSLRQKHTKQIKNFLVCEKILPIIFGDDKIKLIIYFFK